VQVQLNGEATTWRSGETLQKWLEEQGKAEHRLAIEVNGSILPRTEFEQYTPSPGDRIEVIAAIGGG